MKVGPLALGLALVAALPAVAHADPYTVPDAVQPYPAPARANPPDPGSAEKPKITLNIVKDDADLDPDRGLPKPYAPDTRLWHITLSGRLGLVGPTGELATVGTSEISQGIPISDVVTSGVNFGGTLGVGVTRHAILEATVDYAHFGAPEGCAACFGRQIAVALGFSYHLAQGVAVEPWASYGAGLRFSTYRARDELTDKQQDVSFRGVDIARLAVGAEFFPASFFGFGPFLEADIGTNVKFPSTNVTFAGASIVGGYSPAAYAMFQFGLRVTFDPMRAGAAAPASRGKKAAVSAPSFEF